MVAISDSLMVLQYVENNIFYYSTLDISNYKYCRKLNETIHH